MEEKTEPRRRPKKVLIPRREPSMVVPTKQIVYITSDKLTCEECPCFPREEPYVKPKKLKQCQQTPKTLYELAAEVVDKLSYPKAFEWTVDDVADWIEDMGFPQYRECILDNQIDGLRLIMLEDPSKLPQINIHYFDHIQIITARIREVYSVEFIKFLRSIGLPPRKPLTNSTWFKSRTGPSWGIRKNWTRCDVLRWLRIIMPAPVHLDHWDLVWYQKPDFPKVMFARIKCERASVPIPRYKSVEELCQEFTVPRRFRLQQGITEDEQLIWMERRPVFGYFADDTGAKKKIEKKKFLISDGSNLYPKKITTDGLQGKDLVLARRKSPRPKFFVKAH